MLRWGELFVYSEMSQDVAGSGHQRNVWGCLRTCRNKVGCEEETEQGDS